jgi:hypothetical protein
MISILKRVVVIGEGSFKLGILLGHPPISSFDMLLVTRTGFENLMFPFWFTLLGGSFLSSWTRKALPFYSLYPPFLGCSGLFMIGRVSSMPTTTHL